MILSYSCLDWLLFTEIVNQLNALSSLDEDQDDCIKHTNMLSAKSASSSEGLWALLLPFCFWFVCTLLWLVILWLRFVFMYQLYLDAWHPLQSFQEFVAQSTDNKMYLHLSAPLAEIGTEIPLNLYAHLCFGCVNASQVLSNPRLLNILHMDFSPL